MKIYVMRHGLTVWNEKGIIQGRSKNRLSKTGKEKVQKVAKKNAKILFDIIFSSPLMRTMQTSNIVNKFQKTKIVKDVRLTEIDKGIFTKRLKSSLTTKEKLLKYNADKSTKMEGYQSVYNRVKDFIEFLKSMPYSCVLIVTHNIVASYIENILLNKNFDLKKLEDNAKFDNAQIKCFEIKINDKY